VRWLFLIGFWAVATGAMLGTWNGAAHLFADYARIFRGVPDREAGEELSERSPWFRAFPVWITFPPMVLLAFDQGVYLVILYASLGAVFFPFLAATLLYLLNSSRMVPEYRNRILTNVVLAVSILLFVALSGSKNCWAHSAVERSRHGRGDEGTRRKSYPPTACWP
jgi:Mn2+/Fe2+ NRAMP family transporter